MGKIEFLRSIYVIFKEYLLYLKIILYICVEFGITIFRHIEI